MMFGCEACGREFFYQDELDEHIDDYDHWAKCESCTRNFHTQRACNQHMDDTGHWAPRYDCDTCTKTFRQKSAAIQHMNATNHWAPKAPCETCNLMFQSEAAAEQHMKATGHYKNYCKSCDRRFMNENNLHMHLNSKIHRGHDVICPFCKACYTTASGLSHHLETGSCPNAELTRETIYRTVRERDTHGVITYKQIGWIEEENAQYMATTRSWNGYAYECYLCHRTFTSLGGLNQHLNSSVHKQHVYHCPNNRCERGFAALAGLFNHLESEACSFIRFERVQKSIGAVFGSGRRIEF